MWESKEGPSHLEIVPLLDLTTAQHLLETLERDDLEDVTISLQQFLKNKGPLEALMRPTLSAHQWDIANSHFETVLTIAQRDALFAFFTKVHNRALETNSDTVMEEVAHLSTGDDQIMRALSLSAAQNIIDLTNKRSALHTHLKLLEAVGPPADQQAAAHRTQLKGVVDDLGAAICLPLQNYKLAEDCALYAARKTFFMLIGQGKEVESRFHLCDENDENARKILHD